MPDARPTADSDFETNIRAVVANGDDDDHDISRSAGEAHHEQAEPDDVDHLGKALPDWTKRYPKGERKFLSGEGKDPDEFPRGHELNLRLIEVGQAFDKGAPGLMHNNLDRIFLRKTWGCTLSETLSRVGVEHVPYQITEEDDFAAFAGRNPPPPPPLPPARSAHEIEVRPDWRTMYSPEYDRLLIEIGVPTVRGTQVDDYNRRLTELLPPDCVDPAAIEEAAARALTYAFGGNWCATFDDGLGDDRDVQRWMDEVDQLDLPDVCWETYPEQHRPLLQRLGRPDFEHRDAAAYNRALIAATHFLRAEGLGHDSVIERMRRHLWEGFFPNEPCPS
jgi:hypothetical protein